MRSHWLSLILLFSILLAISPTAASSNVDTSEPPVLYFFALDNQHIWAIVRNNDSDFLFASEDGGNNWTASKVPTAMWRLFFVDKKNGWGIVSSPTASVCLRTVDGGRSWNRVGLLPTHENEVPTGVAFDTIDHGWIVGEARGGNAFILETSDSGIHWSRLKWEQPIAVGGLYAVRLHKEKAYAWSVGGGIIELRRGVAPKQISALESINIAFGPDESILSASEGAVYRKDSSSSEWQEVFRPGSVLHDMSFSTSSYGCVAGEEIYCTNDGGRTWSPRRLPQIRNVDNFDSIWELYMTGETSGWALSDAEVFATGDGGYTWHKLDFFDTSGRPLAQLHRESR